MTYLEIFGEDEEGNQGPFIECVREQHMNDREDYIEALEEALWDQVCILCTIWTPLWVGVWLGLLG